LVKGEHIKEIVTDVDSLITKSKLTTLSTGIMDYTKISKENIKNIQDAIHNLESSFSNNCCESNHCQTCQSSKCQSCQTCQGCQSSKCQTCQSSKCQTCQSQCNCNCGGSDSSE